MESRGEIQRFLGFFLRDLRALRGETAFKKQSLKAFVGRGFTRLGAGERG
jgi:hypothetical protein